jgi:hypothetical protein
MALLPLTTAGDTLGFERATGRLVSLRSHAAPEQEFIAPAPEHPAFVIQYLDEDGRYRQLTSLMAETVEVTGDETRLVACYRRLGGRQVHVIFTVRAEAGNRFSHWGISVENRAGLRITDVQFPFVVASYALEGNRAILWPLVMGELLRNPAPDHLAPDFPYAWQFHPEHGDSLHYPGGTFAQFLAYYNDRAGVYLACDDTAGHVKLIKALHRDPGIRLGVAHAGDWPAAGARTLEYEVLLGTFTGDWYAAAELYRAWALEQHWATPLHRRTDVPAWLLDSPPYITIRPQGILDAGPVHPVEEFLPYEKIIPLLEGVSARVGAPLAAVIMGWERGGSWVYPDCFPPIGGDASVTNFTRLARERGWHVGSFCNGTRWVTAHAWNGYDGEAYFNEQQGERTVCRQPSGALWTEWWDRSWRPSYACCLGVEQTREIARDFVRRLLGWGLESIQFFDQNCGAATFPCFAGDHEHPPAPGCWMNEVMAEMLRQFRAEAAALGETEVIHSTEQPANELALPLFQQCDVRVYPPGYGGTAIPLYHYLYHECIIMQGGMGGGPEPHHLPIRNAYNCVLGIIPGAVLTGDGTLLNRDTFNWAPWEPKVGNNDHSLEVIRTATALRRGPGRDFLVYGRMQAPAEVDEIDTVAWEWNGRVFRVPAVFHAAWTAPDGRFGVVLANWTGRRRRVRLTDPRLGARATAHCSGTTLTRRGIELADGQAVVSVPALGCMLVEGDQP